jgi:GxxExxY protein
VFLWGQFSTLLDTIDNDARKVISTPFDKLTYKIIGCAKACASRTQPRFTEDTYQRALENNLALEKISFEPQRRSSVYENPGKRLLGGYYIPDFVVAESIIAEIKAGVVILINL